MRAKKKGLCVWERGKAGEGKGGMDGDGPEQEEGTFLLDYIRILVGNK